MKAKATKKNTDLKKLLSLPRSVVNTLAQRATAERQSVKSYMEKVLIEHANNNK